MPFIAAFGVATFASSGVSRYARLVASRSVRCIGIVYQRLKTRVSFSQALFHYMRELMDAGVG